MKPVIFTTQYNPLGPNINSIFWKQLAIIKANPSINEIFPKDSVHMIQNDHYNIRLLNQIDQGLGWISCKKK